ncbi:beta-propeller domain-containing protein [soil metagenome]
MRRTMVGAVLTVAMLAGCTPIGQEPGAGAPAVLPDDLVLASALRPFDACEDYLDHVTGHALELVGPYGLDGHGWVAGDDAAMAAEESGMDVAEGGDASAPAAAVADGRATLREGVDFSGTNVQEAGIDEPDVVKTDGRILYTVAQGALHVVDVTGDPTQLATVDLGDAWDSQLLLDGDRLLVLSASERATPVDGASADSLVSGGWSQFTVLHLYDVSDPADPTVTETLTLDGRHLSARLVDGVARVVIRSEPNGLPFTFPQASGLRAERDAEAANRQVISDSTADNWIPYYMHEAAGGGSTEGSLVACDRIARPETFSGLGTVTLLTVDLDGGLLPDDEATAVLAGGDTIYASLERLYVATNRWIDWQASSDSGRAGTAHEQTTELHAFDISDPATATYVASGEVPGRLLNQWSLSEHGGHLRAATTLDDWRGGALPSGGASESMVTVLSERDGELAQAGQVDGLGLTEQIYSVRFMGDVGYVVTFRQTDPLYTLDLSDPTAPAVAGELKILGYSAYLHPVGDGLLLGVGQDADERGVITGTQLSLFDVADPADPQRLATADLGQGASDVEYDHRAFLHWPATGLIVVPFQSWGVDPETGVEQPDSGAVAFTATRADGIAERARLSHVVRVAPEGTAAARLWDLAWQAQIRRSLVVGDTLYTVSDAGVAGNDLTTLDDAGWVGF